MGFKWKKIRLRPRLGLGCVTVWGAGGGGALGQGGRGQKEEAELRQEEHVASGHPPHVFAPKPGVPGTPAGTPTHPKTPAVFPSPWTGSSQRGVTIVAPGT